MQRLLVSVVALGALLATVLATPLRAEDKESTFEDLVKEVNTELQGAKTPEARNEVMGKSAKKFLAYAENPKAAKRLDALVYVLRMDHQPERDKASDLLIKDFVKTPEIKTVLPRLRALPTDSTTKVLQAVLEKNPDRKIQIQAVTALIKSRERALGQIKLLRENEKVRERAETVLGKEAVEKLLASGEKYEKEQKQYRQLLQSKYPGEYVDLSIGKKAPEVVSQDLDGKEVKLSDLKGKVVVLDIWATWCGPCRAMIPHEREMVKKLEGKPFVLVSISADAKKETLKKFLEENPMPWTHWWNGARGGILEEWEVEYFPTIYVLDHKGIIRYKDVRNKAMEEAVEKLLKEKEEEKKEGKTE